MRVLRSVIFMAGVAGIGVVLFGRWVGGDPATSTPESLPPVCSDVTRSTSDDPLLVVIETGEAVRFRVERCGTDGTPGQRVCRALWLAQQLDPMVVAVRVGGEHLADHAAALLDWALDDARAVSDPPLSGALDVLAEANLALYRGERGVVSDRERSELLQTRAEPVVIEALRQAERECR